MPRRPARSRSDQKAATRARLVRVGRDVFTRHSFDATSVAMICRAARVTHGALYHHFASKTELFAAVLVELTGEVATRVWLAAEPHAGWRQVEAACDAYLDACGEPAVQAILLRDGPRVLPRGRFEAIDHAINAPLVTGLLGRWIDDGLLRPVDVELVAPVLGGAFAAAGAVLAAARDPASARAELTALFRGWLRSLRVTLGP